ncbi:hypothetical protein LMG28614_05703 [Paraburkholderia ultramafica]|uniref:DUF1275 domain-containing protein n=1 Tax=Paraburkholderia ultramafica TaxID=1544867 RepID=A0A6S7BJR6_9BURK|nr:YoaK family protein [Paraburkholderia ultramafica]CAB3802926.1 hypothetical protein LMG28614_05703 [Paraburkholderia ultramafica]
MKSEDSALAAIAGYVDTLSFVALFGLFTAHVTGNFVLIGADVAGYGQGVFLKLMAFPAFIAGVVLSSVLVGITRPETPNQGACLLYSVQAGLLLAFCLVGVCVTPVVNTNSALVIVCGMLGAAAMGVQNAHSRLVSRPGVPNTVMTGNVTQVVLDALDIVGPYAPAEVKTVAGMRLGKMLPAIISFAAGAIAGAVAYRHVAFWALLLPFVGLVWLAFASRGRATDINASTSATGAGR